MTDSMSFKAALDYAIKCNEDVDVMESPNGFHIIRFFGVEHWKSQGYKTVTEIRMVQNIRGRLE